MTKFGPSLNSQGPVAKLQRNTFNNKKGGQKVGISEHLFQTNSNTKKKILSPKGMQRIYLSLGLLELQYKLQLGFFILNIYLMQLILYKPDGISCMTEQLPQQL